MCRLPLLTFLIAAAAAAPAAAQEARSKAPNVLFIAVDDLNDWIGALGGHPQAKTPNMDRLAKRGVNFTRAYCAAPACNPSRTAILTGIRPASSGVYHNNQPWRPVLQDAVTLMQYLMQHGYLAMGCGKIFHGGFEDKASWNEYFKGKYTYNDKEVVHSGVGGNMQWGPINGDDNVMADTQLTDWALGKLKQKHEKPFFLAVGYAKPHLEWHAPKKYFDMHPLDKIKLPVVKDDDLDDVPPTGVKMANPQGDHKKITDKKLWPEAVQAYLACHTYVDGQIGRLIDALLASPHADNTIIILWGDHGWHLGEKQHWRKFALWEEACRVPFMIVAPGVTQPGVCQRTVNLIDIYPTVIDLCGLPAKKGLEGHSLLPLLRSPATAWEHPSLTTHGRNNHALRSEKWRYIRYADGSEELYNHDSDPQEWTNLAKSSDHAAVIAELAQHLPKMNAPDAPKQKEAPNKKGKASVR